MGKARRSALRKRDAIRGDRVTAPAPAAPPTHHPALLEVIHDRFLSQPKESGCRNGSAAHVDDPEVNVGHA